jgi:hypothetical protein
MVMSLAQSLADAVAFQIKFYNREDSELKERRELLWSLVESEVDKRIAATVRAQLLRMKNGKRT